MRASSALLALALLGVTSRARAEIELVPAENGHLGAWLVSGPFAKPSVPTKAMPIAKDATPAPGLPAWRLLHVKDGALDLGKAFGLEQKGGSWALVGGELWTKAESDGWLLLSSDGPLQVYVDEKLEFRRDAQRLRDGSWDAIPIAVDAGRHRVVILTQHPGNWWAFDARWLDGRDLLPPENGVLALPGTTDSDKDALAERMLTVSLDPGVSVDGYRPRLSLEYRRGAPRTNAKVTLSDGSRTLRVGSIPLGPRGVGAFEVLWPMLGADAQKLELTGNVGSTKLSAKIAVASETVPLVARANKAKSAVTGRDTETLRATLEWRATAVMDARKPNELRARSDDLRKLLDALDAHTDVLATPGRVHVARRSPVDDQPDPILIHVPDRFAKEPTAKFPLVVALHGLNGNEQGIMDAFLDSTRVDGFVIAPYAHGNAFYRGPGEREVMAAID